MRRLYIAAIAALLTVTACGGDSGTTPNPNSDDITGTYTLKTVNGAPLPYTIQVSGGTYALLSDVVTVASNGSWSESYTSRQTVNGATTNGTGSDGGTWVRAGASVVLHSTKAGSSDYSGTYANGTMTLTNSGLSQVFSR